MKLAGMICVILVLTYSATVYAQEPGPVSVFRGRVAVTGDQSPTRRILKAVEHRKRVYVDEQKRLYVALSAPLYIRLSLSPVDDDGSYLLHDPKDTEAAVPFYLDGPGRHSINHPGALGKAGTTMHVYADGKGPTTTASLSGADVYKSNGHTYYGKGLKVSIESTDDMTGVQQTYVARDDTVFTLYQAPFMLSFERQYQIRYYGVDNVGNSESISEITFTVDATPPIINVRFSNAGSGSEDRSVYPVGTKVEMEAVDTLSGLGRLAYAVNSDPEQVFTQSVSFDTAGDYTVVVRASDRVGNSENQLLRFSIQ